MKTFGPDRSSSLLLSLLILFVARSAVAAPPTMGEKAPDFTLTSVKGTSIRLSTETAKHPIVLIVLRGYPGYQCPFCNRQVQDFIHSAEDFSATGSHVIFVYPGPSQNLGDHANEFLVGKGMPSGFEMVLDPDYKFTDSYGLRWNGPQETAYPSTFLIDEKGVVYFRKISKEHGGRTTAAEVLQALRGNLPVR